MYVEPFLLSLLVIFLVAIAIKIWHPEKSELVLFRSVYKGGSVHDHIISRARVDTMLKAELRLHCYPGINPHNKGKTAEVVAIYLLSQTQKGPIFTTRDFEGDGPYWWTTPNLHNNNDPRGAKIYTNNLHYEVEWGEIKTLWEQNDSKVMVQNLEELAKDGDLVLKMKRAKKINRDFSADDLSSYLLKYLAPLARVTALDIGVWTKIGETNIKLLETTSNLDFSYARFATENQEDTGWITSGGQIIPETNIMFDTWYVGDSTDGIILAFETVSQEETA